ncbi:hypothetical protein KIPB_013218 [Kipferlia bialata]|uniref:Uncharacterized protein n=1 Tax=Kipferlia bialata TaxID=797122 RepID=A0A391P165_9EUKA|nr:hypothetical protein KIPB_013218 [Kipferlia bialata]|eukprot:g13218.t1
MATPIETRSEQGMFLTWLREQQARRTSSNMRGFNMILSTKVEGEPCPARGDAIRRAIYTRVTASPVLQFDTLAYAHRWDTCMVGRSDHFAAHSPFNRGCLVGAIKQWLQEMVHDIRQEGDTWEISFLLSEPLAFEGGI